MLLYIERDHRKSINLTKKEKKKKIESQKFILINLKGYIEMNNSTYWNKLDDGIFVKGDEKYISWKKKKNVQDKKAGF